jgi:hypothetical protein
MWPSYVILYGETVHPVRPRRGHFNVLVCNGYLRIEDRVSGARVRVVVHTD